MTDSVSSCPACGEKSTGRGRLTQGRPGTFSPDGLRFWTLTVTMLPLLDRDDPGAPPMTATARACTSCGLVWTHVDPERLRAVIEAAGSEEMRARLVADDDSASR